MKGLDVLPVIGSIFLSREGNFRSCSGVVAEYIKQGIGWATTGECSGLQWSVGDHVTRVGSSETIFALQDSSPDEASSSESKDDRYLPVYSFKEIGSSLPTPTLPCVEVHVLATKFSCPKKVIAYMDIGAQITMMIPNILPTESW
ncbi:hypothetical protein KIW84_075712 [Lathyrus oleraceus]|uniref:Uncharacterized protein n=1 Tax=Pisum sativum TaxID=3888 RepID=A0A9D5A2A4_PEA|nr:hypothetical protein KIW84_075712 [Pisum sativum]